MSVAVDKSVADREQHAYSNRLVDVEAPLRDAVMAVTILRELLENDIGAITSFGMRGSRTDPYTAEFTQEQLERLAWCANEALAHVKQARDEFQLFSRR